MASDMCIIINPFSGAEKKAPVEEVRHMVRRMGLAASVEIAGSGDQLLQLAQSALSSGARTIVAGGGDGTVSSIAAIVSGTEKNLGVLPLGTLNHFARDIGIPQDIEKAVWVLLQGHVSALDTGKVNGRIFINNSSLGLYPWIVLYRRKQQKNLGLNKWLALLRATLAVLGRYRAFTVRLTADGGEIAYRTPLVFIGNNEYSLDGFAIGTRKRLDRGSLWLYMLPAPGKLQLFRIAAQGLFHEAPIDSIAVKELYMETERAQIEVALDGEVLKLSAPLHYSICPASLNVLTPPDFAAEAGQPPSVAGS